MSPPWFDCPLGCRYSPFWMSMPSSCARSSNCNYQINTITSACGEARDPPPLKNKCAPERKSKPFVKAETPKPRSPVRDVPDGCPGDHRVHPRDASVLHVRPQVARDGRRDVRDGRPGDLACILNTFNARPRYSSRGHAGASPGRSRGSSRRISFWKEMSFWKDS